MLNILMNPIGIMSAMPEEAELIRREMKETKIVQVGKRQFVEGTFQGVPVVFCPAGIGKVSAAVTATLLIDKFNVGEIVFTGVAGGGSQTAVGDIVVGGIYLQHDLDLQPIFPQFYIYSLDTQILYADKDRVSKMMSAANRFLTAGFSFRNVDTFKPKVHNGIILTGDQFIHSQSRRRQISDQTKKVLLSDFHAMEMEGAAVAQVCHEMSTPFIVVRSISDKADQKANIDFPVFINQVARHYSLGILTEYFREIKRAE